MRGTVKVKVNLFSRTHLQLNARRRAAGAPDLGVEHYISSTMPTLLDRRPFVLVPLKLPSPKLPRHSIRHV